MKMTERSGQRCSNSTARACKHGRRFVCHVVPIGRYVGLDNQVGLAEILAKVRSPARMVRDETAIWEIMLAIASAKAFVGTSLHGNVTSQSYAVPHFGLSDRPCKVEYYLQVWDLPEQDRCFPVGQTAQQLEKIQAIPKSALEEKRKELIGRAHTNFAKRAFACDFA